TLAGNRVPVAVVQRTGHALVGGTARDEGIGDEVVAVEQAGGDIRMRGQDAGVEDRHHHAFTLRLVPGRLRVDATDGVVEVPLVLRVVLVVGHQQRLLQAVDVGRLHRRVGGNLGAHALDLHRRQLAAHAQQVGTGTEPAHVGNLRGGAAAACIGGRRQ